MTFICTLSSLVTTKSIIASGITFVVFSPNITDRFDCFCLTEFPTEYIIFAIIDLIYILYETPTSQPSQQFGPLVSANLTGNKAYFAFIFALLCKYDEM